MNNKNNTEILTLINNFKIDFMYLLIYYQSTQSTNILVY